jgi:hypothetical protein
MTARRDFGRDGRRWSAALGGALLLSLLFLTARADAGGPWLGAPVWTEPPSAAPLPPPSPARRESEEAVFRSGSAAFAAWIGDDAIRYAVQARTVLPGSTVQIRVSGSLSADWHIEMSDGQLAVLSDTSWLWRAPLRPGTCALRIRPSNGLPPVHLNIFVLRPADGLRGGYLNGYRVGAYPRRMLRGMMEYRPPDGFIELTRASDDVLVSPHFTLGQFRCKQTGDPAYLVLSEPLLHKLESLLEEVNRSGIRATTLAILSGYRTPSYNAAIGNETAYSRHLWGDAADIYIDCDSDGRMDDLDGDGRVTQADARVLQRIAERLDARRPGDVRPGGISAYRATAAHGPFVHVDARGFPARW